MTITIWVLISVAFLALSPMLLALAALAAAVIRRRQPVLLVRFAIAYFALELRVLARCAVLWVVSGFGTRIRSPRFRALHYELLEEFVHRLAQRLCTLLDLAIAPDAGRETERALESDQPLLFLSRHAGLGDTLLLIDLLLTRYRRLPSVVFKDTLAVDPCIDLIGHRLPHAILDTSAPDQAEARIAEVAANLAPRGVLVLFPEGGNFTLERRRRALRKLWREGRRGAARRAREMSHVMPPRPGGTLAALRGRPDAKVVFSVHTGLGLEAFPRELWRKVPTGGTLRTHMWLAPADERPADPDEQVEWLYGWWERLDRWLEDQGQESPRTQAASPAATPGG